jgi:multidrug efflux pump subunit AcrA (membrane-fusion protein)
MTISALRQRPRPDNLRNQPRTNQSLARRIYLGTLLVGAGWIALQIIGPLAFLDADGLIMQDRKVVGADYTAQVLSITARPGDRVGAGHHIGTVVSTQMLDLMSDLTSREAQATSRREQIDARLVAINETLPAADQRAKQAEAALIAVEKAAQSGLATITRRAELSHDRYEAAREAAGLRAEASSLASERAALQGNLNRIASALYTARATYRDGVIMSPVDGTVGPKIASPGAVLRPGEPVAEIYHGAQYVVAYLPTNRFYSAKPGDRVVVSDGGTRRTGKIERVEGLADALPAEFQSNFRSIERRQVVRVAVYDDIAAFPLLAKVNVSEVYAPANLAADVRDVLGAFSAKLGGSAAHARARDDGSR